MKIQCDVCDKAEASLFCPADEAALCRSCDHTIHHANKLATKHPRFSLIFPTSKDYPLCDICQEKRAYLFCQEDRALLCRECDLPIHRANEHTQKHNRFLLTGVKLSATSMDSASSSTNCTDTPTASEGKNARSRINRPRTVSHENLSSSCKAEDNVGSDTGSVSTSSISEYLIETIPGYCFEELLDGSFAPNGFCKKQNHDHRWAFEEQDLVQVRTCLVGVKEIPNGGCYGCAVPFKTSHGLIKNVDQLLVKICWKISSMVLLSSFLFGFCACILFINFLFIILHSQVPLECFLLLL